MNYTSQERRIKKIADKVKQDIETLISIDSSFQEYKGDLFISLFSLYLEKGIDV